MRDAQGCAELLSEVGGGPDRTLGLLRAVEADDDGVVRVRSDHWRQAALFVARSRTIGAAVTAGGAVGVAALRGGRAR